MTQLVFMTASEKRVFDSPPVFTKPQRPAYFVVTDDIRKTLSSLRTPTTKVGFLLQLGYFKHSGKFFDSATFRKRDVQYIRGLLNITEKIDFSDYQPSRMMQHQTRIRQLLGWNAFDDDNATHIAAMYSCKLSNKLSLSKSLPLLSSSVGNSGSKCQPTINWPTSSRTVSILSNLPG